jgi:mersacidin/lichenicidin family type 2 lantibiotic
MHYSVVLNGQTHSAFAELIFRGPQPFAVLAWNDPDTREEPLVAVPLNPADLMESQEETIDFVYGREL